MASKAQLDIKVTDFGFAKYFAADEKYGKK